MIIYAIETSCDETAVAVLEAGRGRLKVLASEISSQVKLHARWGGVVPNLAAREHLKNIVPVFESARKKAGPSAQQPDLLAVTAGPGLIPALLVGTNFARTLAYVKKVPLLGIHHIEGHIYANLIDKSNVRFPLLALVVSGGHTQLILMTDHFQYRIVGQTLDDAAGEAFDKVARILGLSYPGGPIVSRLAAKFLQDKQTAARLRLSELGPKLPRPMIGSKNLNFSFSGLKTAVLYLVKKIPAAEVKDLTPAICAEFQQAAIDVLVAKTLAAAREFQPQTIILAGGVSANTELRRQLSECIARHLPATDYHVPEMAYSLDNAAMIAAAAYFRWQRLAPAERRQCRENWRTVQARADLGLSE